MQPLGTDHRQTAVGIPQHQHRIRLNFCHQRVGFGNDVAAGLAEIAAHRFQIHLRIGEFQILEKHAVQIIIVILSGVRQDDIKIPAALGDHRRQPDDLGPRTDDNQQLQLAIFLPFHIFKHGYRSSARRS